METGNKPIEQLPIQLYESVIDIVAGEATMLFVPLTYTLATEEAERIGVDHVARVAQSNDTTSNSFGKTLKTKNLQFDIDTLLFVSIFSC